MERPPLRRLTRQFRTLRQKPATLPCGWLSPSSRPNTRLAHKRPTRANVAGLRRKLGDVRRGVDLEAEHDMVRGAGVWNPLLVARNLRLGSELVAGECDRPPRAAFSSSAAIGDSPNFSMCSSYSHFRFHACFLGRYITSVNLGRYITSVNFAPSPGFDETMASPPCNCAMCLTIASPSPVPPSALLRSLSIR